MGLVVLVEVAMESQRNTRGSGTRPAVHIVSCKAGYARLLFILVHFLPFQHLLSHSGAFGIDDPVPF